jgi:hypothetical protein
MDDKETDILRLHDVAKEHGLPCTRYGSMRLTPSFLRASWVQWCVTLTLLPAVYFTQSQDYTLVIPFALIPFINWFVFVPRRLEFTDSELTVDSWIIGSHKLSWNRLRSWGYGRVLFSLTFDGCETVNIAPYAYPNKEWSALVAFLTAHFLNRKLPWWLRGYEPF